MMRGSALGRSDRRHVRMKVSTINPILGSYSPDFLDLIEQVSSDPTAAIQVLTRKLEACSLDEIANAANVDQLRYHFICSLVQDVESIGGKVWTRDSRLQIAWPDWDGQNGRENARKALLSARDMRPLTRAEIDRVRPMFCSDSDGDTVATAVETGKFWLESADAVHPCGTTYGEAFSAALRLWTMPYRGRQGRSRRFAVVCQSDALSSDPVVAGVIEMGDEAPFCRWRDHLLGLSTESLIRFVEQLERPHEFARDASSHLRSIRRALLPTSLFKRLNSIAAQEVVNNGAKLADLAKGRSVVDDEFAVRKRLAHGLRLAQGEVALRRMSKGKQARLNDEEKRWLASGVRAIKDLVTPRVHMEATVCGAVPPFDVPLGGKLIVAFLAHPHIIDLGCTTQGSVLKQSFDVAKLERSLPVGGLLAITTKGLYAQHAPMYHRASVPGRTGELRLKHVDNTEGTTTTFLSTRTAALAKLLLANSPESDRRRVSWVYGSGGAKRHRSLEAAASICGLSGGVVNAGINRPVYSLEFAKNPEPVIWSLEAPDWRIDRDASPNSYSDTATDTWRRRWLGKAKRRVLEYAYIPSPVRRMGNN